MAKRLPETARIELATAVAAPIAAHRAIGDPSTQINHDSIAVTQSTSERTGINVIRAKRAARSGRGLSQRDASALTAMVAATRSTSAPMAVSNPIVSMASAALDPSGTQSKMGIIARAIVFGRAFANIRRTGQDPSAESDPVGMDVSARRRCGTYREPSYISSCLAGGNKQLNPVPSTTPPVVAAHVIIGAVMLPSTRAMKLRLPNNAANPHPKTRAGTDATTIVCHLTVDRSTGNAAVQERDAAICNSARRRETSAPATIADIVAQNRSCRCSHEMVDTAAARWVCTYIHTAAIQAMESASGVDISLRPRRRQRFPNARYAVNKTGVFANHCRITRSMCKPHAAPSYRSLA